MVVRFKLVLVVHTKFHSNPYEFYLSLPSFHPHHACTGSTHHYPSQPTISSHLISSHHMADAEKTDKSAVGTESNVTEDGGIVKKILKEGEGWQSPGKGADVTGMS